MDDDWLEGTQGGAGDPLVDNEWKRLATRYSDAGYREGITDGKLSTLQQGFDQGFSASVGSSRRLGQLRGRANALLAQSLKSASENDAVRHLREFIRQLGAVKRDDVMPVDSERVAHEREEHGAEDQFELDRTDGRDMEGLEMAMEGVASAAGRRLREGELLDDLERRFGQIEQEVKTAQSVTSI